jgi:hypothetical protein
MYLLHQIAPDGRPVFILVCEFSQKDVARKAGFTWNNPQHGAWATMGTDAVRNIIVNRADLTIAPDTLDYIWQNTAMTDATYARLKAAYVEPTRKQKAAIEAAVLSDAQVQAVHQALQLLASVCDGAMADDRAGFNRNDIEYGHSLANAASLSRGQAGYGKLLLEKYRGQLGDDLYSVIFPEKYAADKAAAAKKAEAKAIKASPKLHKQGMPCDWQACPDSICIRNRQMADEADLSAGSPAAELVDRAFEQVTQPVQLPSSSLGDQITRMMGGGEPMTSELVSVHILHEDGSKEDITDQPERHYPEPPAEKVAAADEIYRLSESLATCHPADFDTTVDLLRALRQIDAPKQAGSDFTKEAWTAAGYQTK